MRTFLLSIEVHLETPIELVTEEGHSRARLSGFVQELGVRAVDVEAAKALVRAEIDAAELGREQKTELIFIEIDEIESGAEQPAEPGVYRRSGRSFYSEE